LLKQGTYIAWMCDMRVVLY